jgi:eukaryotic-like serine/threonine-protein kinase
MATSLVGKKIGNYNITRQLGEGGMGAVYLGEHPLIGKKVAVKVLHDELAVKADIVQRFFTEAKAVNDIHHENIVDIVDFGQMKDEAGKDLVYFLMELLEGEPLNIRLKRAPLTPEETVHIMDQCTSALAASHAKGIVHRDLKPDNIYLVHRGHDQLFCKLLDFGIAKLTGAQASSGMTRAGSVLGTPAYMSPEQCDGRGNIDWRSDVYSLGVVMYEMLAHRVPFTGDGFGEILVAHLTTTPPPPTEFNPSIPTGLEQIVMRCLEKSRDLRFQSMDELRQALQNCGSYRAPRPLTGLNPIINDAASAPTMAGGAGVDGSGRPTTLSGSAGERMPTGSGAAPAPSSKAPLFAVIGLLVAGGGGAGVYFGVVKKPDPPPVVIQQPPPKKEEPKDDTVHILLDSTPEGASITRAGLAAPIGKTPYELKLKKGEPSFDVLLSLEGFKPETRTVSTERDRDLLIALGKVDAPPPTNPPPTKESGRSGHGSKGSKGTGGEFQLMPERGKGDKPADPDGVLAPKL